MLQSLSMGADATLASHSDLCIYNYILYLHGKTSPDSWTCPAAEKCHPTKPHVI